MDNEHNAVDVCFQSKLSATNLDQWLKKAKKPKRLKSDAADKRLRENALMKPERFSFSEGLVKMWVMRVNLKTENIELSPTVEIMAERKLIGPIKKLLPALDEKLDVILDIELGRATKHHNKGRIWKAEAQLSLPGIKKMMRAETRAESLREAVNLTKNAILREIKKYKEKSRIQD